MYRISVALIGVGAIVASGLAAVSAPMSSDAAFPGPNGLIAFMGGPTGDLEVYSVNEDGTGLVNLSQFPGAADAGPAWSPDGSRLLFMSNRGGGNFGIYVMNADGSEQEFVAPGSWPAWSPDGEHFVSQCGSGDLCSGLVGGPTGVLIDAPDDQLYQEPDWSPDGEEIAFSTTAGIAIARANGSNVQVLTDRGQAPSWSPDGQRILYTIFEDSIGSLHVLDVSSRQSQQIVALAYGRADWSPDGHKIVYGILGQGLWIADSDGDNPRQVTGEYAFSPRWARSGQVEAIEFTQAIQQLQTLAELKSDLEDDGHPPVPIVAGKPAVMRVYLAQGTEPLTTYRMEVTGEFEETIETTINNSCTPEDRRRQEEGCRSADFYFHPPDGDWSVTLKVKDSGGDLVEEHTFDLTSVDADAIVLDALKACDVVLSSTWYCGNPLELAPLMPYLRQVMPTARVDLNVTASEVRREHLITDDSPSTWWHEVADRLNDLFWTRGGGITLDEQHYMVGVASPDVVGLSGTASDIPGRGLVLKTGTTAMGVPDAHYTLAHELAHTMGAHHTNTEFPLASVAPGCWSRAISSDTDWIHEDNFVRSDGPDEVIEVGFDVADGKALPGDEYLELMGYCVPQWISPRTYNKTLEALSLFGHAATEPSGAPGPQWLVRGTLDGDTVTFRGLLEMEGVPSATVGTYTLQVLDASDQPLFERGFEPSASHSKAPPGVTDSEGAPYFSLLVPVQVDAAAIVVTSPDDLEIGRVTLGGEAPVVTVTAGFASGELSASWSVTDNDSSEHTHWVQYSTDNGESWETLVGETDETTATIDDTLLGGSSNALVRVLATDGVNTGVGVSDAFAVPSSTPSGEILSPASGTFAATDVVWLQAFAFDPDDGTLEGNAIAWSSSRDGTLGTGASLPVYDLSTGTHTITMTARDSDNNTVMDTISVSVSDRPLVDGEEPGVEHVWGDNDCNGSIGSRDGQALSRLVLAQNALSQTQPCPALGDVVTVGTASRVWGDIDCNGSIGARDGQALLRNVLGQPPLSQTQPCPLIGDTVSVASTTALPLRRWW